MFLRSILIMCLSQLAYTPSGPGAPQDRDVVSRFVVYDGEAESPFPPGGYMPHGDIPIGQDADFAGMPHGGEKCYRVTCKLGKAGEKPDWMGVAFVTGGVFNDEPIDVFAKLNAKKGDKVVLRFWACSATKSRFHFETVPFKGAIKDPNLVRSDRVPTAWTRYEIDCTDKDLSHVNQAFSWALKRRENQGVEEAELKLDDIEYVKLARQPAN